jgi:hypothetical protein
VIVALLTYLIPRSSILTSLTLDWLDLTLQDAMHVIRLIPGCRSLRTLHFNEIVLREEGLRRLLEVVPADQLQNVEIRECDLTDDVVPDILKYIEAGEMLSFVVEDQALRADGVSAIEKAVQRRIEHARADSERLREAIAVLRGVVRDDLGEDKTFAVGPGARQFKAHLEDLLKSVARLKKRRGEN